MKTVYYDHGCYQPQRFPGPGIESQATARNSILKPNEAKLPMDIRSYNSRAWDAQVKKGNRWTQPVSSETIDLARRVNSKLS